MAGKYSLKLYVTGQSASSERALANLRRILDRDFGEEYDLTIVDVLEQPQLAEADKIFATPTLIKQYPPPVRRIVGDLANHDRASLWLGLSTRYEYAESVGEEA